MNEPAADCPNTLENTVCTLCAAFCDDVALEIGPTGEIRRAAVDCGIARDGLEERGPIGVSATDEGRAIDVDAALELARERLREARAPAIVVGAETSLETATASIALARSLDGAWIPLPIRGVERERAGSDGPDPAGTWGELRSGAKVVIFWGVDPGSLSPRFLDRYVPAATCRRVLVHDEPPRSSSSWHAVVCPDGRRDAELDIAQALLVACGREASHPDSPAGSDEDGVATLVHCVSSARHIHVFIGGSAERAAPIWSAWRRVTVRLRDRVRITLAPFEDPGRTAREASLSRTAQPGPWLPTADGALVSIASGAAGTLLATSGAFDLVVAIGAPKVAVDPADIIAIGPTSLPGARPSIVVPGLDPRLRATVVRADGIRLTLCGHRAAGVADPTPRLLERLREGLGSREPIFGDAPAREGERT